MVKLTMRLPIILIGLSILSSCDPEVLLRIFDPWERPRGDGVDKFTSSWRRDALWHYARFNGHKCRFGQNRV